MITIVFAFIFGVLVTLGGVLIVRVPLPPRVRGNPFVQRQFRRLLT